ncbi:transposase [Streptomyces chartreusis]|uniref:transposase n=1 Tax=Streptomyces chartreusis TaxID=1969 RepID=UPI00380575B5
MDTWRLGRKFQRKWCQVGSKSNRSRRYTEEFKRDAVALVRSSGRTVTEVARQIGVSAEGLRNWVKQDSKITGKLHGLGSAIFGWMAGKLNRIEGCRVREVAVTPMKSVTRSRNPSSTRAQRPPLVLQPNAIGYAPAKRSFSASLRSFMRHR